MNKKCKQCEKEFEITDDDLAFYHKISPTFAGKTFEIPAPTLCPDCRQQHRIVFRNFWNLYKRKCDLTGQEVVAMYAPEPADGYYKQPIPVYETQAWWSDSWNPLDYGRDWNHNRSFFDQLGELLQEVPRSAVVNVNSENCSYSNLVLGSKNCYLVFGCVNDEDCYYGHIVWNCKDCVDCLYVLNSELCYMCVDCIESYGLKNCQDCKNCANSSYLYDCVGCRDCFGCVGLRERQYCLFNQQLSEEEYKNQIANLKEEQIIAKTNELKQGRIVPHLHGMKNENVSGDYLNYCKNVCQSYDADKNEDCRCLYVTNDLKDSMDVSFTAGAQSELIYNSMFSPGHLMVSCHLCTNGCENLFYCEGCSSCKNCFGCSGLKSKQYCILNKQYSKEDYEQQVAEIIERMIAKDDWGDFFPINFSPFGYNESIVNLYYPLNQTEAAKVGANLREAYESKQLDNEVSSLNHDISFYSEHPEEVEKVLAGSIRCEVSGKLFKILPHEMSFYLKQKINIPTKHYDVRRTELFALRNPRVLYHRKCMNEGCQNEFETTYAPDRPEKVFCESCYQKAVL